MKQVLSRAALAALVPHRGSMCLLEEVLSADDDAIICRAISHRDGAHPLREDGCLSAVCGIEYAAQAMAVHGALRGKAAGGPQEGAGMLAAARHVVFNVERLDDIAEDLVIEAHCLLNESGRLLYRFEVRANNRELLQGRATVVTE